MKNTKQPTNKPKLSSYWIYALVILFFASTYFIGGDSSTSVSKNINISSFERFLNKGEIKEVTVINKNLAQVTLQRDALNSPDHKNANSVNFLGQKNINGPHYVFEIGNLELFQNKLELAEEKGIQFSYNFKTIENKWFDVLIGFLPLLILVGLWIFFMRRMSGAGGGGGSQIFSIGKSKAKLFDQKSDVKVTFKDVAGLEGAKEEVQEIVDFLKNPTKYTKLGGKIPKGALLVGLPGTGKTLLAKAVAGEAKVPFFSLSGSDFVEMFVGVGASRVRDLFKQAKEKSPAIIFIDEIDAIGRARGKSNMTGGNDERENTLNQLLTEMDGFGTNTNVIVIAATNRADVLDKALMRAGRFDRQIYVDLPDVRERKEIFAVHLKPIKTAKNLDTDFLSKQTPGFSGADIANVCNEAALIAARKSKKSVNKQDFLDAVDRIVGGLEKKNKIITENEKKTIAFHEAGHATVSWFLEHAAPLVKVTIVPRGRAMGLTAYLPENDVQSYDREFLMNRITIAMGGRAAEELIFNELTTGASNDIQQATDMARNMICRWGMSDKLGPIVLGTDDQQHVLGRDIGSEREYSEDTAVEIDKEMRNTIKTHYRKAKKLLKDNIKVLHKIAEVLIQEETIEGKRILELLGTKKPKALQPQS